MLGDYLLLKEIARGGMGVVYLARQMSMGRLVALKTLSGGALQDPTARKRFQAEAEAIGSLRHPHIVTVHDIGCDEGRCYFSMEFIQGVSLSTLVQAQPIEPGRAAGYVRGAAEAVHHAHQHGVIHRDLKPGNILIDEHDRPKVADFGLSKRLAMDSDSSANQTELTRHGEFLGTPAYMAPEQLTGSHGGAGPSSDVYSLGAVLYHCLTGRPPFVTASREATLLQVIDADPISPRRLNPAVSLELDAICRKCLEKDPGRRYASSHELADDLGRYLRGEPTVARPLRGWERLRRWARRKPALAALAIVSTAGVLGFTGLLAWTQARLSDRKREVWRSAYVADLHLAQQSVDRRDFGRARELLERYLPLPTATTSEEIRGWEWYRLWELCRADPSTSLGPHDSGVTQLEFSPDGAVIYSLDQHNILKVWDVASGSLKDTLRITTTVDSPNDLKVSPDGKQIALVGDHVSLQLIDAATLRPLVPGLQPPAKGRALRYSPDGRHLGVFDGESERHFDLSTRHVAWERPIDGGPRFALAEQTGAMVAAIGKGTVFVVGSEGGTNQPLYAHEGFVTELSFDASGSLLASTGTDATLRLTSMAAQSKTRVIQLGDAGNCVAVSRDGSSVAVGTGGQLLRLFDSMGSELTTFRGHGAWLTRVRFSRDGNLLASSDAHGSIKLWSSKARPAADSQERLPIPAGVKNAAVSERFDHLIVQTKSMEVIEVDSGSLSFRRLPLPPLQNSPSLALSADGGRLAVETTNGGVQLYQHRGTEWSEDGALSGPNPRIRGMAFSPDGGSLVVDRFSTEVEVWDLKGRILAGRVAHHPQSSSAWIVFSPDGTQFAMGYPSGQVELIELRGPRVSASWRAQGAPVTALRFSPRGHWLVTAGADGRVHIWEYPSWTKLRTLKASRSLVPSLAFSPDGGRLLAGTEEGTIRIWEMEGFQEVAQLRNDGGPPVFALGYAPDGETLISCSLGDVCRWRAPGGKSSVRLR